MKVNSLKSTLITCILAGTTWACSDVGKPGKAGEDEKSETPKPEDKSVEKKEEMRFEGPGEVLPKEVDGFSISSPPRYFGPDNLHNLINGGAEIYVEFGLNKMVTADYTSTSHAGATVTVEVYDQGSLLGAFGRFARFLAGKKKLSGISEGLPDPLKEKGRFGGTDLVYYKYKYLVHVTLLDESPDATVDTMTQKSKEILPSFATAVAQNIPLNPKLPGVFKLFPKEKRIERSQFYDVARLGGRKSLGAGFGYRYKSGKARWSLLITEELPDSAAVLAKIEKEKSRGESKFYVAGNRIIGYRTFSKSFGSKQEKIVESQLEEIFSNLPEQLP